MLRATDEIGLDEDKRGQAFLDPHQNVHGTGRKKDGRKQDQREENSIFSNAGLLWMRKHDLRANKARSRGLTPD